MFQTILWQNWQDQDLSCGRAYTYLQIQTLDEAVVIEQLNKL